ncbi:hypothetical protein DFQ28_007116 [Apophysomyces sp. BC1034]|nr:hypothetical protein DFQ30_007837 [Apophysomyces sp. BC1015]KAG0181937.1 hypothetical protein DFQ29_006469 [Apophysomyces sp. BC1021]KAG0192930.1 hypothetical protein DFQ28_007116 [Apophysomyces sp. BC1034]
MFQSRVLAAVRPASSRLLNAATKRFSTATSTRVVERELPAPTPISRRWRLAGGVAVGAVVWGGVLASSMNYQRTSSSVVNGTLFTVRYDPRVIELLGDKVDYADQWPWISGTVNHLKGRVDVSFDVSGSTGERGRVHFCSVRQGQEWKTVEFTVTRKSDKKCVEVGHDLLTETGAPSTVISS